MPDKMNGFTQSSYPAFLRLFPGVVLCPPMRITKLLFQAAAKVGQRFEVCKFYFALSLAALPDILPVRIFR